MEKGFLGGVEEKTCSESAPRAACDVFDVLGGRNLFSGKAHKKSSLLGTAVTREGMTDNVEPAHYVHPGTKLPPNLCDASRDQEADWSAWHITPELAAPAEIPGGTILGQSPCRSMILHYRL